MQCQICSKKTATIHLTEISNGARTELHFCESCAVQQGIAAKSQISVNELLSNLLESQPADEEVSGGDVEVACPKCGFTLNHFRKEGVLGCPNDYVVFEKALLPLIEKAHGGRTRHCGKIPTRAPQEMKFAVEQAHLREKLRAAIQCEDYEQAAKLHERINQLKQTT